MRFDPRGLPARFWRKVDFNGPLWNGTPCWLWTGYTTSFGHGQFGLGPKGSRVDYSHRISWEAVNGKIPDGMHVHHKCQRPACVNPEHLQKVTTAQHGEETRLLNRLARTYCSQGHALTEENSVFWRGSQKCRECIRVRQHRWYMQNRSYCIAKAARQKKERVHA